MVEERVPDVDQGHAPVFAVSANEGDVEASTVHVAARCGQWVGADGRSLAYVADPDLEDPEQRVDDVLHARVAGSTNLNGWMQPGVVPEPVAASFGVEETQKGASGVNALEARHGAIRVASVAGAQLLLHIASKIASEHLVRDAERVEVDPDVEGAEQAEDVWGPDHGDVRAQGVEGPEADAVDPGLRGAMARSRPVLSCPRWRK